MEVKEEDNKIIIETENQTKTNELKLDLSEMNVSTAWYNLISAYRSGAETINVYHNDYIKDIKSEENIKSEELLRDAVNKFIGLEIVKQGKNNTLIKEITSPKVEEFDSILKRTYFAVMNMSEDMAIGIENSDQDLINNILISEVNVNKLSNFTLRLLTKYRKNNMDSIVLYSTIIKLEELGDCYANISKIISESKFESYPKNLVVIFKDINSMMKIFYDISFKHDQDKHNNLAVIKHKIKTSIKEYNPQTQTDARIMQIARNIPDILMEASCIKSTYRINF